MTPTSSIDAKHCFGCNTTAPAGSFEHAPHCMSRRGALSTDSQERKNTPVYSGVLKYFPRALAEVAKVSKVGNDKHNPGQPLHWSKGKSNDHLDCVARHLLEAGTIDLDDGCLHSAKLAWRALANLETELEAAALNTKPVDMS